MVRSAQDSRNMRRPTPLNLASVDANHTEVSADTPSSPPWPSPLPSSPDSVSSDSDSLPATSPLPVDDNCRPVWLHPNDFEFASWEDYPDLVDRAQKEIQATYMWIRQQSLGLSKLPIIEFLELPGMVEGLAQAKVDRTPRVVADLIRKGENATSADFENLPAASELCGPMNYIIYVQKRHARDFGKSVRSAARVPICDTNRVTIGQAVAQYRFGSDNGRLL
jgi:hypothetical protein